ncbi:endolytic transglycosylase MltG [Urechidicola sp. KH5]
MNNKKLLLGVSIITLIIGVIGINYYLKIFGGTVTENVAIYIPSNATFEDVKLLIKPHIKKESAFDWVAQKKKYPNLVKGGKYDLTQGMNTNDLVDLLRSGNQSPIKIAFNNQHRIETLAGRISQQIEADSISLLAAIKDEAFLKENGFSEATALAMYLPNSYQLYWNTNAEQFRNKMLSEYRKYWNGNRLELAKKQNLSPIQVSTLASIVHKETSTISERPRVAGLYLNRYKNKWPLQADPTIIFALKEKKGQDIEIKRVLLKDLEINSKYNTYKYVGIPPGPIAMPDISAIEAVLKPENHNYFYMCADIDNFGKHVFARTLAQHNKNAAKYQRWLNKQGVNR